MLIVSLYAFEYKQIQVLTTIKGTYCNGKIELDEIPPFNKKAKVMVTFLEEDEAIYKKRELGSLRGKISVPDNFNEPLDDLKDYMF